LHKSLSSTSSTKGRGETRHLPREEKKKKGGGGRNGFCRKKKGEASYFSGEGKKEIKKAALRAGKEGKRGKKGFSSHYGGDGEMINKKRARKSSYCYSREGGEKKDRRHHYFGRKGNSQLIVNPDLRRGTQIIEVSRGGRKEKNILFSDPYLSILMAGPHLRGKKDWPSFLPFSGEKEPADLKRI